MNRFWRNKGDPPETGRPIPRVEKTIRQEEGWNDIWPDLWEVE